MHALIIAMYALITLNAALVLLLFFFGGRFEYDQPDDFDADVSADINVAIFNVTQPHLRSVQ